VSGGRALVLAALAAALLAALPSSAAATPPAITVVVSSGTAGANGWWVTNLNVQFQLTGTYDSVTGCAPAALTTEGTHQLSCSVSGAEGGASLNPVFKIDKTPPSVTGATPSRAPDANGWYNAPLSVAFGGSDGGSGIASCTSTDFGGPDTRAASVAGSCTDRAGLTGSGSFALRYDATPPAVTVAPERPPNAAGWYNRPVRLAVGGSDELAGLESCSSAPYAGPDAASVALVGTCRDVAGNAASKAVAIRYDATPPKLGGVRTALGNGAVTLRWSASTDAAAFVVRRRAGAKGAETTVYSGTARAFTDRGLRNGIRYHYTVLGSDQAGNVTTERTLAVPRALFAPADGARVRTPPLLRWAAVAGAGYYNVQLYRGTRKILTLWPASTRLRLHRAWTFDGRRLRLGPGVYRWYVFPGFGARKAGRYGKLLGGSTFRVVR
jgi:hypothetical protein